MSNDVNKPHMSIVTVTYNSRSWLEGYFDSVLSQVCEFTFEIIVVDNGSKDGTQDFVRDLPDPRVKLILSENHGFGAANNLGVAHASGECLFFLNADTVLEEDCLGELDRCVLRGQAATPKIVMMDNPDVLDTCGNRLHFTGFAFVNGHRLPRNAFGDSGELPGISGAAFGILKQDYNGLGGFDEDFFLYMEDTDLSWRMRKSGLKIVLCGDAVVRHCHSLDMSVGQFYHLEVGRMLLLRKHFPFGTIVLLMPSLVLCEVLSFFWAMRFGLQSIKQNCRAKYHGLTRPITSTFRSGGMFFCQTDIPFAMLSSSALIGRVGSAVNMIFRLNFTLVRRMR